MINHTAQVDRSGFPIALASRANRLGSDQTIQTLIEISEAKMLDGGGEVSFLLNGSENGKTAAQELRMDCIELFTLAGKALDLYRAMPPSADGDPNAGAAVCCSYADFSGLSC